MEGVTNARRKLVKGLDRARERRETGLFKAEGTKCVLDLSAHFPVEAVYATRGWLAEHPLAGAVAVTRADLERMTSLATAPEVIALLRIPAPAAPVAPAGDGLTLALDGIQDPGNLGTIIRTADWWGFPRIVCSRDTADCYAPKVVQSTMGSLGRVEVDYVDSLAGWLDGAGCPVCGTFLGGDDLYRTELPVQRAVIVIGNEGHGIGPDVARHCTRRLTIPRVGPGAESLNAAVAAALVMARFRTA